MPWQSGNGRGGKVFDLAGLDDTHCSVLKRLTD